MPIMTHGGSDSDFIIAPAGNWPAVCTGVFDEGTHLNNFNKYQRKVRIRWELHAQQTLLDNGDPMIIYNRYTLSHFEQAHLRQHMESWRGRAYHESELPFDVEKVLGQVCALNVLHNVKGERTYANVMGVTPLMDGVPHPTPKGSLHKFSLDEFDARAYLLMPEFLQRQVQQSEEWKQNPEFAKILGMHQNQDLGPQNDPGKPNTSGSVPQPGPQPGQTYTPGVSEEPPPQDFEAF